MNIPDFSCSGEDILQQYKTQIERTLRSIDDLLEKYKSLSNNGKGENKAVDEFFKSISEMEFNSEMATIDARKIAEFFGCPHEKVTANIFDCFVFDAETTEEGWFHMTIPVLLPKIGSPNNKKSWSKNYIRNSVACCLERYFNFPGTKRRIYDDCVIIYKICYDNTVSVLDMLDHDNIEHSAVTNEICSCVLKDDNCVNCDLYIFSDKAEASHTEVFVVPRDDFPEFLRKNKNRNFVLTKE